MAFYCQECGHRFKTLRSAEKAAFGDEGCPSCGSSDIDEGKPELDSESAREERN